MTDSFFVLLDRSASSLTCEATDHTRGPWDRRAQHGGPPSALIGDALERLHPREDTQFVRVTCEILRPVPVERLTVTTRVLRVGRRVELLAAELTDEAGATVMTAQAWRIRTTDLPLTQGDGIEGEPLPGPDRASPSEGFFREIAHQGYVEAMETRFVDGDWGSESPVTAWMRMRYPLIQDQPTTALSRVLIAADSGNGLSARFDGLFINPDLTVYLTRLPAGEWVCLKASTTLTNHGIGLATSVLHDESGPLGRGSQSLLLDQGKD